MGMTIPNLNVIVEDGRYGLTQLGDGYTMIGVDAYRVPYVPWQLTTVEFFEEVQSHLAPDGVVIINVGRTGTDRRLSEAMTATLLEVFPTVHTMDVPNSYNTILVATQQPTSPDHLRANLAALPQDASPVLRAALQSAAVSIVTTVPSDLVFTDDHAPVEWVVDSMVIDFVINGGINELDQ